MSLRDWFPGYYSPSAKELAEFVKSGIVVPDTNVLLDLYRVLPDVRIEQINALKKVGDRLWIPHRVGQEFHERRFNAVRDQSNLYSTFLEEISSHKKQMHSALEKLREGCAAPSDIFHSLLVSFDNVVSQIIREVERLRGSSDIDMGKALEDDHVLQEIDSLFDGRVGPPFSSGELDELNKQAQARFVDKIPPGYCDSEKDSRHAFGDFYLWEQLLRHAENAKRPVLFVTRENKEDWIRRDREFRIGPRPELVAEMLSRAGVNFYLVKPDRFLKLAKEHLGAVVSHETLVAVAKEVADTPMRRSQGKKTSLAQAKAIDELLHRAPEHMRQELAEQAYPEIRNLVVRREIAREETARASSLIRYLKQQRTLVREEMSTNPRLKDVLAKQIVDLGLGLEQAREDARSAHDNLQMIDKEIDYFIRGLEAHIESEPSDN